MSHAPSLSYYGKTGGNEVIASEISLQRPSDKSTITISAVPRDSLSAGRGWEGRHARIFALKEQAAISINRDPRQPLPLEVFFGECSERTELSNEARLGDHGISDLPMPATGLTFEQSQKSNTRLFG
jgi:hypothetical protein